MVASVVCSTCGPPCEQLLTAADTGAGLSIVGGGGGFLYLVIPLPSRCRPSLLLSPSPPLLLSLPSPSPVVVIPAIPLPCRLSSPVAILLPVVPIPIAPRSHPASSCSRRWLGVLWWWPLSWCHVTAPVSGKTRNCELLQAQELMTLRLG